MDEVQFVGFGAMSPNSEWSAREILKHVEEDGVCCFKEETLEESISVGNEAIDKNITAWYHVWKVEIKVSRVL